jgi:hypothetical protein
LPAVCRKHGTDGGADYQAGSSHGRTNLAAGQANEVTGMAASRGGAYGEASAEANRGADGHMLQSPSAAHALHFPDVFPLDGYCIYRGGLSCPVTEKTGDRLSSFQKYLDFFSWDQERY